MNAVAFSTDSDFHYFKKHFSKDTINLLIEFTIIVDDDFSYLGLFSTIFIKKTKILSYQGKCRSF